MGILMRNGINYSGSQLPSVTTTDEGKVLTVNGSGVWTAQEVPNNIADVYDSTLVYNAGDCCMFEGVFYQCNTDSTTGTWDSSKWDPTTVFQSVSDGKELIADAITDKGVPTSATDTFQDMADNIGQISSGSTGGYEGSYTIDDGTLTETHVARLTLPNDVEILGNGISTSSILKSFVIDEVVIPNSVTTIKPYAFRDSPLIKKVVIPNSVTTIGANAFTSCTKLAEVVLPTNTISIPDYCFSVCSALQIIDMSNVRIIGTMAFQSCSALQTIDMSNVVRVDEKAFYYCTQLQNVTFSNTATYISRDVFWGCRSLAVVDLPENIKQLGLTCFYGCTGLQSFTIRSNTLVPYGTQCLDGTNNTFIIYVPADLVDTYKTASGWSNFADRIQAIPT